MSSRRFQFGLFEFDVDTLALHREGAIVRLQAQPAQVLAFLVQNAGRIISRDELQKLLWGDQTFVDFERGLNFCISQIRSALGEDAASPTYIRTVPKQGYQFIAPIREISSNGIALATTNAGAHRPRALLALLAVVIAVVGFSTVYGLRLRHPSRPLPIVAVVRFDNETGDLGIDRFTEDLTDNFVERLTSLSAGKFLVIGNAQILRGPRDTRDLKAIATNLGANFVVLGQIQAYQGQTRILAHLIRMPDQTHVSVARLDRQINNPLELEAEAAQNIATKFSHRLATGDPMALSEAPSR